MKVFVVGEGRRSIEAELSAREAFEVIRPPEHPPGARRGEVAELAAALRALEALLAGEGAERVVIAGSSDLALAAVLVATKMGVPVAAVGDERDRSDDGPGAVNSRLIARLADTTLDPDPGAAIAWLRRGEPAPR
jgi:UDP-N-acetylglucosamine 2-epimerase